MLGTIRAAETLKCLLAIGAPLVNRILFVDILSMEYHRVEVQRNPGCAVCGELPTITALQEYAEPACGLQAEAPLAHQKTSR